MPRFATTRTTTAIAAILALGAAPTIAAEMSTLTAHQGDAAVTGEIKGFKDGAYLITTLLGDLVIPADTVNCEGPNCRVQQVAVDWQPGAPGGAAEIVMHDGSMQLTGTVQTVADGKMLLVTQLGDFNLPVDLLNCTGPGCPVRVVEVAYVEADSLVADTLAQAETAGLVNTVLGSSGNANATPAEGVEVAAATPAQVTGPAVRLAGPQAVIDGLMPIALGTYAEAFGARLSLTDTGDGTGFGVVLDSGERILSLSGQATAEPLQQIALLAEGQVDVAFTFGDAPREATALVANAGKGDLNSLDQQRVLAMDGLVAVVSPDSDIEAVSLDDLDAILTGQIANWSELGGPDMAINVLAAEDNHLRGLLPETAPTRSGGNAQIVQAVMQDPAAIGFVPFSARGQARTLSLVSSCGIQTAATPINIKTEQYPLMQRVVAYNTNDATSEELADFLAYLDSAELDEGIRRSGFVDLGVQTEPLDAASAQVAREAESYDIEVVINGANDLLQDMKGKQRLSTVFRFDNASTRLDRRSERDLRRVIDFMAANPDARFTIVGFTDSVGTFGENQELAQRRADTVLGALRQADTGNLIGSANVGTKGVGELYPLACNGTGADRGINRRVEVWMAL